MSAPSELTASPHCQRENCFVPDIACVLGQESCPNFVISGRENNDPNVSQGGLLPWSGLALGLADLSAVAALGRSRVVAVVGAAGAGKTTLLAAHWLAARRGDGEFGRRFAGSYTLVGWHRIARHLQWVPYGQGFPPHTTTSDHRSPALLHMAISVDQGAPVHVLHTDVPGEWYSDWAYNPMQAPGVQWIADSADTFVILADSEALAGVDRGSARGDYETLAHRLASVAESRPVVPVQTKADVPVSPQIQAQIDAINARLFGRETVRVSIHVGDWAPVTSPIDLGTEAALAPRHALVPDDRSEFNDSFLAFRSVAGQV